MTSNNQLPITIPLHYGSSEHSNKLKAGQSRLRDYLHMTTDYRQHQSGNHCPLQKKKQKTKQLV